MGVGLRLALGVGVGQRPSEAALKVPLATQREAKRTGPQPKGKRSEADRNPKGSEANRTAAQREAKRTGPQPKGKRTKPDRRRKDTKAAHCAK